MEEVLNAIVDSVNKQCERLMEKLNDQVFEVKVYYFYDGEAVDLGACVAVCDINEKNFREEYLSFTVHEEKLKLMILVYLELFEKYDRYFQLKKLAREIPKVLKEKGKYITKTTHFEGKRTIVGILTTRATVLNSVALACSFCNYLEA